MKITHLSKDSMRLLRVAIDAALQSVTETYGVKIHAGNATFNPDEGTATFKLNVTTPVVGANGTTQLVSPEGKALDAYAQALGFSPEVRGMIFIVRGKKYSLEGYNARRPKYPFIGKDITTGKRFKFADYDVRTGLGLKPKAPLFGNSMYGFSGYDGNEEAAEARAEARAEAQAS